MGKKNRKHSIIDSLPCDIKEAVDEMIKANFTYREIADYIQKYGVSISLASVQRYASRLEASLRTLRLAQENFRAIMAETDKYPNLDITDGILRLLSNQILEAINKMPEDQLKELDFETLSKNAIALTRAAAYKKQIDVKSKDVLENGADQFKAMIFEAMASERPELYKEVRKFIESKQEAG
ncbi:MAG: DUF3486 family protein [Ruminococcus sp.]|nr:DUF3486 family protein [Ruminococcus sp.]